MGVKFEVSPFSIGSHLFNGATLELTKARAFTFIKQLERGISLMEREEKMEANPEDGRFKGNAISDGSTPHDEVNIRQAMGGKSSSKRYDE